MFDSSFFLMRIFLNRHSRLVMHVSLKKQGCSQPEPFPKPPPPFFFLRFSSFHWSLRPSEIPGTAANIPGLPVMYVPLFTLADIQRCIIGWLRSFTVEQNSNQLSSSARLIRVYGKIWAAPGKALLSLPCLRRHPLHLLVLTWAARPLLESACHHMADL